VALQINSTENRPVLHVALRASRDYVMLSDGKNVVPEVWKVLDKIQEFSERVRNGSWVIYCCYLVSNLDMKFVNC
jgi:glucose-6-phosphate isomerase